jgi:hypothetical protein
MSAATQFQLDWRDAVVLGFRYHKNIAERAIAQISDEALHRPLDANINSIAVVMKHVGGNLRSRWVDFLTTDGEKPWRNRDDEFVDSFTSRQEVLDVWEAGWAAAFGSLGALTEADFDRTVTIRGDALACRAPSARSLTRATTSVRS